MQRFMVVLVVIASFLTIPPNDARADSSDLSAVMEKYVNALGGRAALSKIHSSKTTYKSTIAGRVIGITTTAKAPFYFLQVFQALGSTAKTTYGFDGTTAWTQAPDGTVRKLTGEKRAELVADAVGANDSEIFPDRWPTAVSLRPSETVDGKSYAVLRITPKGGIAHDLLIDPQSGLPVVERTTEGQLTSLTVVEAFGKGPLGELQGRIMISRRSDGAPEIMSVLREAQDNAAYSASLFAPPLGSAGAESI